MRFASAFFVNFKLHQSFNFSINNLIYIKRTKMVRVKHRYLLINILYPQSGQAAQLKVTANDLPDVVHFHQPTPSNFKPTMLLRLIHDSVTELFGDYGNGMISGSVKGTFAIHFPWCDRSHLSAPPRPQSFI
jgi:hypothetical protein